MSSTERTVDSAISAISAGQHVDVVGDRLSGRSTLLSHVADHFRREGWVVMEIPGRASPDLLPALDAEHDLIVVDDWDRIDNETRTLVLKGGVTIITSRVGGEPATGDMHAVVIPALDADALRVLLTRVLGFVIEPEDAQELADLTGGAAGAAIGVANSAREMELLTVEDGRGRLQRDANPSTFSGRPWVGAWRVAADPVVATLLESLTMAQTTSLTEIARLQRIPDQSNPADAELERLGYLKQTKDCALTLASPLVAGWFYGSK